MGKLSIEEQEFNLNKRMALFENRLAIQCLLLSKNGFNSEYDSEVFILKSMQLLHERFKIVGMKMNTFKSGGIGMIPELGVEMIVYGGGKLSGRSYVVSEWLKKHPEAKIIKK